MIKSSFRVFLPFCTLRTFQLYNLLSFPHWQAGKPCRVYIHFPKNRYTLHNPKILCNRRRDTPGGHFYYPYSTIPNCNMPMNFVNKLLTNRLLNADWQILTIDADPHVNVLFRIPVSRDIYHGRSQSPDLIVYIDLQGHVRIIRIFPGAGHNCRISSDNLQAMQELALQLAFSSDNLMSWTKLLLQIIRQLHHVSW